MNETILNVLKAMDKEAPATIDMIEKVEKEWNVLHAQGVSTGCGA